MEQSQPLKTQNTGAESIDFNVWTKNRGKKRSRQPVEMGLISLKKGS